MRVRARILFKLPLLLIAIALAGWIVMVLWNWIIPPLFAGAHAIDYARALGLLVLCRILFGSLHGGHRRHHRPWQHWKQLSPQERQQLYRAASKRRHRGQPEDAE